MSVPGERAGPAAAAMPPIPPPKGPHASRSNETGRVLPGAELADACRAILAREDVAYVHIRSRFNCFQCRV